MKQAIQVVLILACAALTSIAAADCDRQQGEEVGPPARSVVVMASNQFAVDLYHRLAAEQEGKNLFFSPVSLSTALAMTREGAEGQTREQMGRVLKLPPDGQQARHGFSSLLRSLNVMPDGEIEEGAERPAPVFELRMANALWSQQNLPILPQFVQTLQQSYAATMAELDFQQPEQAAERINQWVAEQTGGKITQLVSDLPHDTSLVLTNAIYFLGHWVEPFEADQTREEDFFVRPDEAVQAPMMRLHNVRMGYQENEMFRALQLPYQGERLSMVILVPREVDGLKDLERELTTERLVRVPMRLPQRQVSVFMPRFRVEGLFSLRGTLSQMGMPLAFSEQADFSGMTSAQRLFVDDVLHRAVVQVDETGTEAAAATGVVMRPVAAPVEEPIEFRVDRPFAFYIQDSRSGAILFVGRVIDPLQ